ncbi:MAG: hypothetical protein ACP5O0_06210 [Acidimicrobiales bacterium]
MFSIVCMSLNSFQVSDVLSVPHVGRLHTTAIAGCGISVLALLFQDRRSSLGVVGSDAWSKMNFDFALGVWQVSLVVEVVSNQVHGGTGAIATDSSVLGWQVDTSGGL